ncbi:dolichyl-di-phosphooligosaccharide-protein glycotransferase, putative, partial [Eimeria acervulina]
GGETTILSDLQKDLPFKTDSAGRFVADPQCVVYNCKAEEPLFTSPADKKAFALWQEAQLLAEKGETDSAAQLFRLMTKVSPELAHYYGM